MKYLQIAVKYSEWTNGSQEMNNNKNNKYHSNKK